MAKTMKIFALVLSILTATCGAVLATPSTQIWIPSTDIQPFKTFHLGIDNYFRASHKADSPPAAGSTRDANIMDIGPEMGVLPFEKLQMEVGFDYLVLANDPNDNHPWSGNFKLGTPEGSLFKFSPALAAGMYNVGPSQLAVNAPLVTSGQNIVYALAAKTLPAIGPVPSLGRLSAGYYHGSAHALVDANNPSKGANDGILASWDRTMSEISDKLWMAVDYMSGNNVDGGISMGVSWAFAKNVSVILGYDIWKEKKLAGNNTFTTQVDINFP
jgi:hypothetical protein